MRKDQREDLKDIRRSLDRVDVSKQHVITLPVDCPKPEALKWYLWQGHTIRPDEDTVFIQQFTVCPGYENHSLDARLDRANLPEDQRKAPPIPRTPT